MAASSYAVLLIPRSERSISAFPSLRSNFEFAARARGEGPAPGKEGLVLALATALTISLTRHRAFRIGYPLMEAQTRKAVSSAREEGI